MKKTKLLIYWLLILALLMTTLVACNNGNNGNDNGTGSGSETESESENVGDPLDPTVIAEITFDGASYTSTVSNVLSVSGNVLTINHAGTYKLSGRLDNAQLRVYVAKTEQVTLIFNGISITNSTSAPLYIESADKVTIELASGTENFLTDSGSYFFPAGVDKPNACLYSSEDLTIKGSGSLQVKANYNNGIGCKNDLKIKNGTITVDAIKNAIKGDESVQIEGGVLSLKGADGIKADEMVGGKGFVEITGGTITILASDDGIQAITDVTILTGASVTIDANDQDINCDGDTYIDEGTLISR